MRDVRYAPSSNQNVEPRGAGCAGGSGGVGGTNGERASDGCFSQKQFFLSFENLLLLCSNKNVWRNICDNSFKVVQCLYGGMLVREYIYIFFSFRNLTIVLK